MTCLLVTGYIQSPGFDNPQRISSYSSDTWRINIPHNNKIMITFLQFSFYWPHGKVVLFQDFVDMEKTLYSDSCGYIGSGDWPRFFVIKTLILLSVSFGPCFRMYFSFHNQSRLPQFEKIESVLIWNCSVPYWNDFRHHLECNWKEECENLEDETDCPYSEGICPPAQIAASGTCFKFQKLKLPEKTSAPITVLEELNRTCAHTGGYLATIDSAEEWRKLYSVFQKYQFWYFDELFLFLDLQKGSSKVPAM